MKTIPIKRALLSVSDKSGIVEFARELAAHGVEIISTGGTSRLLAESGITHKQIDEVTGLPEMLDGRVKTLHPKVHGGILGKRDTHAEEAKKHQIDWIDLVVVNFYPFSQNVTDTNMEWGKVVEYIDIGGPTMVRAAAKNFDWVGVVVDPSDYSTVLNELNEHKGLTFDSRRKMAGKVFALTSSYDTMISDYFKSREVQKHEDAPTHIDLRLLKQTELRYGENPHQKASAYYLGKDTSSILAAHQHQGKPLSYNNILDTEAAWNCVQEFDEPCCIIVKHANPCGAAVADNINDAYERAYQADSLSAFGGIVALNRPCTKEIAEAITNIFMEVVIAPEFTKEALELFAKKPNLRILSMPVNAATQWEMRFISGGVLMQERDAQKINTGDLKIVTKAKPSENELNAMLFAWQVLKHIKSNGILIAKDNMTVGIGAGQVSRIDAVDMAVRKSKDNITNAILASDAFFPFRDSIDRIGKSGIRAIIQPGGSVRDDEVIAACDEHNIAMVFTGKRCFRH